MFTAASDAPLHPVDDAQSHKQFVVLEKRRSTR